MRRSSLSSSSGSAGAGADRDRFSNAELQRVREIVEHDLLHAGHVAHQHLRHFGGHAHRDFYAGRTRFFRHHRGALFEAGAKIERSRSQFDFSRLDLGKIKDVIDQRGQKRGATPNGIGELALTLVERGLLHRERKSDDA